ncbi:MAG: insulinase family protein [Candidatus Cloacimonetes bacterium]|nr:insulinase family protein [Candidatus Cloacimonadota bacterium]
MKKRVLILILFLTVVLLNSHELMQKTLPNGMEIVVKENKLNESIGFYCFVKTGSVNEGKYLGAGISHYLEHIVCRGTTKYRTEDEYEKMLRTILNENSMPYYITYYEAIGLGYDYIDRRSEIMSKVTADDIINVANKYFKNIDVIVFEPSEDVELMVE